MKTRSEQEGISTIETYRRMTDGGWCVKMQPQAATPPAGAGVQEQRARERVKLFTHNDADGVSCAVLAKLAFGERIDIEYCRYEDINKRVTRCLRDHLPKYERLLITDISVNEDTAKSLERLGRQGEVEVILLDHHQTAEWLNRFDWAQVRVTSGAVAESGTSLFYRWLCQRGWLRPSPERDQFVEQIRQYDTWVWKETNNEQAKQLNDLLQVIGRERYVQRFVADCAPIFTAEEQRLLELEQEKIDKYIKGKARKLFTMCIDRHVAGVVFAEQYVSELGNALAMMNPELDFIAIMNLSGMVSYRTIKDDVNVGEIAKRYGGGGHQKAAASPLRGGIKEQVAHMIFQRRVRG